jgi:hypothetical protein
MAVSGYVSAARVGNDQTVFAPGASAGLSNRADTKPFSAQANPAPGVREIVRAAKNSHGGFARKWLYVPCFRGFVAGAARGIRTPDPIITKDVPHRLIRWQQH